MRPSGKMLIVLTGIVLIVRPLAVAGPATKPARPAELAALIAAAQDAFVMPQAEDLAAARRRVLAAQQALVRKLADQPDGQSKRAALKLDEIAAACESTPEIAILENLADDLGHRRHGVQNAELETLCAALEQWLRQLRTIADERAAEEYARQVNRLAAAWQKYRQLRQAELGLEIQEICQWLDDRGQSPKLTEALRGAVSHPNHRMLISASFLQQALARDISQPLASNEMSQGAQVRVRGQIQGKLMPTLVPHADAGAIRIQFVGTGHSQIVANKGPVSVQARGRTDIQAGEIAYVTERGLSASAPKVAVQHRSTPYNIGVNMRSRLLRRIVTRIAWNVAGRQQAQSDRQAAYNTRKKIDAEVRRQTAQVVAQANDVVRRFGVFSLLASLPEETLKISTTAQHLVWQGRYASVRQFAAPSPAPTVTAVDPAVLVQLHESALNNSKNWIAGRTIYDADFRELTLETFGLIPEGFDAFAAQLPATITLADERPLTVRLDGGQVDITLRLKGFGFEGREFAGRTWTATASYRPRVSCGKVELLRTAPIAVLGDGQADAATLEQALSRFLVARAASRDLAGKTLASLPPMTIGQFSLDGGWLTLALVAEQGQVAVTNAATRR